MKTRVLKRLTLAVALLWLAAPVFGQVQSKDNLAEASVYVAGGQAAGAVSWHRLHRFGKGKQRLKVGYGLRLSAYFGSDQDYVTAPAALTSGKESFAALFSENIAANLDTLRLPGPRVVFLNAAVYLAYTPPLLKDRLDVGMNIDAIGFSLGNSQNGTFVSDGRGTAANAKPTAFNILLISDSDRGSLNSEWYVRYWLNDKWAAKAGLQFMFTEYTTDRPVQRVGQLTNDRFRNKSSLLTLGVSRRF